MGVPVVANVDARLDHGTSEMLTPGWIDWRANNDSVSSPIEGAEEVLQPCQEFVVFIEGYLFISRVLGYLVTTSSRVISF